MNREPAKVFQDLVVWQKAHQFVLAVYRFTAAFPEHEKAGLAAEFRRAAVGIAAHVAESFGRKSKADKVRYLNFSQSAVDECNYYLILAKDLGYGENEALTRQLGEVRRLLADYAAIIATINFLSSGFTR